MDALLAQRAWVRALAHRLVSDADRAEEIEQRTWLAAIERPPGHVDSPRGWLATALRNAARKLGRAEARRSRHEGVARMREAQRSPADLVAETELQQLVGRMVLELDEPYRETVLLRYVEGLEPVEIARRQGVPPETVRTRLHRAIARLRERLDEEHRGGRAAWTAAILLWCGDATPRPPGVSVTASAMGGITMAATNKAVLVTVVLALLALGGWGVVRWAALRTAADKQRDLPEAESPAAAGPRQRTRSHVAPAPAAEDLVPPVDLDSVDPDRDLAGLVVGPDGAPVSGAFVQARVKGWQRLSVWVRVEDEMGPSTRTAADGSFRLRLDPATPAEVVVRAAGYPEQVRSGCRAGQRVTIRLAKGTPLVVEVVDDAGQPVPGATVFIGRSLPYGDLLQKADSKTGANGIARFADVLAGYAAVEVAVDGVSDRFSAKSVRVPHSEPWRVVLPARARIEGSVTDRASGAPIEGATVARPWATDPGAATDAQGRFSITLWQWKSWIHLQASKAGFGTIVTRVDQPGTTDFALIRSLPVKGRAVAEDGSALPDARVAVVEFPEGKVQTLPAVVTTAVDADGRFSLTGATPGSAHALIVVAPGRQRVVVGLPDSPAEALVDVGDVVVARGRRISGVAVDAEGHPCVGDKVTLFRPRVPDANSSPSDRAGWITESVLTDGLGRFRFDALAPGAWNVALGATDAPQIEPATVQLPPDRDVEDVRVAFPGSRTLSVRVVDDLGAPVAEASIQVVGDFGQVGHSTHPLMGWTDGEGRARFRGLPAAPVRPYASVTVGRPYVPVGPAPEVMPEGQEVVIVLARAVALRGRVLDEQGKPLAREYVDARNAGSSHDSSCAETAADGSFEIMVAAGQVVNLRLRGTRQETRADGAVQGVPSEYHGVLAGLRGPLDDLVLRASKEPETFDRTLTVLVEDVSGLPVSDIEVDAGWGMKRVRALTDASGRALLEKLPAEQLRVTFWTGTRRQRLAGLQVPPAPIITSANGQDVRARFRQGVEIRGRVVDNAGKPVRASISARAPDYAYTRADCDADGRFVVAALPGVPSHVEADVWTNGEQWKANRAGVVPGQDEIELVVRAVPK